MRRLFILLDVIVAAVAHLGLDEYLRLAVLDGLILYLVRVQLLFEIELVLVRLRVLVLVCLLGYLDVRQFWHHHVLVGGTQLLPIGVVRTLRLELLLAVQEGVLVDPEEAVPLVEVLRTMLAFRKLLYIHVELYTAALLDVAKLRDDLLRIIQITLVTVQALADVAEATDPPVDIEHVFEFSDLLVADLRGVGPQLPSKLLVLLLALQRRPREVRKTVLRSQVAHDLVVVRSLSLHLSFEPLLIHFHGTI